MFRDLKGRVRGQCGFGSSCGGVGVEGELVVVAASRWTLSHFFVFESDCQSVVVWATNP